MCFCCVLCVLCVCVCVCVLCVCVCVRVFFFVVCVRVLLENSPVAEHQSNGDVERANRDIEDQATTLKDALEERLGETIPPESTILPWLIEHSAWIYNNCHAGRDMMTASEREKGTK